MPKQNKVWRTKWPHVRTNTHLSVLRNGQYVLPNINWRNKRFLCPRCKHPVSPESTDVSICPRRPPIAHMCLHVYANPLTVYTHWSGHRSVVSGWCTLFTSGCSPPVLFSPHLSSGGKLEARTKKKNWKMLSDSHLAWRIMSVTK